MLFEVLCAACVAITFAQVTVNNTAVIINLEKTSKTCPAGYQDDDDVCTRTVFADAERLCTAGTYDTASGLCVATVAREASCMAGFIRTDAYCVQNRSAQKVRSCPTNSAFRANDSMCVQTIQNPPQEACPAGSTASGGQCLTYTTISPIYVCPDGFTLNVTQCYIEENFLCNPNPCITSSTSSSTTIPGGLGSSGPTTPTTAGPPVTSGGKEDNAAIALANLRNARVSPNFTANITLTSLTTLSQQEINELNNVTLVPLDTVLAIETEAATPYSLAVTESAKSTVYYADNSSPQNMPAQTWSVYRSSPLFRRRLQDTGVVSVVTAQAQCRRTRTVNATLYCSEGYLIDTGECQITSTVGTILIPSGYTEIVTTPNYRCPTGYSVNATNTDQCVSQLIMTPDYTCPAMSTVSGDSCLMSSNPIINCPTAFTYTNGQCVQTQSVPFQVEYVIRYQCQGKNCDPNNNDSS